MPTNTLDRYFVPFGDIENAGIQRFEDISEQAAAEEISGVFKDVSKPSSWSCRLLGRAKIRRWVCSASARRYRINANRNRHSLQTETPAQQVSGLTRLHKLAGKAQNLNTVQWIIITGHWQWNLWSNRDKTALSLAAVQRYSIGSDKCISLGCQTNCLLVRSRIEYIDYYIRTY